MLYVSTEAFKASASIPDSATDADVTLALTAASRAVEKSTRRRFWKDETPTTRTYTARLATYVAVHDIAQVDQVAVDGTVVTDYFAEPLNALADEHPYLWLRSDSGLFTSTRGGVEVTGLFGWPAVPAEVPQMVTILASRLLKRSREAPFGVVNAGGIEGAAIQLTRTDPEMQLLIGPLTRVLVA